MKRLVVGAIMGAVLLGIPLSAKTPLPPKPGCRLPKKARPTGRYVLIHSSDIAREFSLSVGEIVFFLGANSKSRISHIETRDPKFSTPEGVRVGDQVKGVLDLPGVHLGRFPGCFAFVMLRSGWAAGFVPVEIEQTRSGEWKGSYRDLDSAADVRDSMKVGFIFKSIYLP